MAKNDLPMVLNRQNSIVNIAKRYINQFSSKSNNRKVIDNLMHIKQYGVLSMPAFKMTTDEIIKKSPEGTIVMADINDLFVANKFRGKDKVNKMLKDMIGKIKFSLDESQCKDYKIGKMGDEIYIYLPDKNEQEADEITSKLQEIKEKELSISVGSCSDLSKGLTFAMNIADERMAKNKNNFKRERLNSICGNNLEKIIDTVVETQLDKMRLNLQQLKESNKDDLRNTFDKAISQIDVQELIAESSNSQSIEPEEKQDTFEKLRSKYAKEAKSLYGDKPEQINEYVLASMLSKHPVDNVISSEYFQNIEFKKAYKNIKRDKTSKGFSILAVDLSGLKTINDTLGHDAGDDAIADSLEHVKNVLASKNITMYSSIVAKGGGNSYVLINKNNKEVENEFTNAIQQYGTNKGSKYNMSIITSIKDVEKDDLKKSNFIDTINSNLTQMETTLQEESFNRKLNDVDEIKSAIKKIYRQVINMDDIQLLSNNSLEHKNKVFSMIKKGFEKCVDKERDQSSLNIHSKELTLQRQEKQQKVVKYKPCIEDMGI